jgi:hypothetical protein
MIGYAMDTYAVNVGIKRCFEMEIWDIIINVAVAIAAMLLTIVIFIIQLVVYIIIALAVLYGSCVLMGWQFPPW